MTNPFVRVVDFETNGQDEGSEVCEVGIADLDLVTLEVSEPGSRLCLVKAMPPEVRAVHHIRLSDVALCDPFNPLDVNDGLTRGRNAIAAHNAEFECRYFAPAVPVICTYKVALRVWPEAPGHSNGTLRYWLEDKGLLSLDDRLAHPVHRAGPDAYVTAHILKALVQAGVTGQTMVQWSKEPALLPSCPIGQYRGRPWPAVDTGFLQWMLRQDSMEADLKWNAQRELDRRNGKLGLQPTP